MQEKLVNIHLDNLGHGKLQLVFVTSHRYIARIFYQQDPIYRVFMGLIALVNDTQVTLSDVRAAQLPHEPETGRSLADEVASIADEISKLSD
jgi:hypothetical protein